MVDLVYVERSVREHARARAVLERLPHATVVGCDHYGEIFNRHHQSFRLQKLQPALVLADKHAGWIQQTPTGYGVGGTRNYYFSHLLNCPYDCRYCFLQGMFRSAHYVLFVGYERFVEAIDAQVAEHPGEESWFFSGYDCDSLALEGLTGFAGHFLEAFATRPGAFLELRTKGVHVRPLLERPALANVVVAMSLSPAAVCAAVEHGTPSLERRLQALGRVAEAGWPIGLRFDPVLHFQGAPEAYQDLLERTLRAVPARQIHSVTTGLFRLPRHFSRQLQRQHPDDALLAAAATEHEGMVSYAAEIEERLLGPFVERLQAEFSPDRVFVQGS